MDELVNDPEFIKTVTLNRPAENMFPIYKLGERINLSFDDITAQEDDYYYQIEHYDYNWEPSALYKNEFMTGVDDQRIINYRNSFTTLQAYSHYELSIPNRWTEALTRSGNYMIHIYNDDRELLFSRKFMIVEPRATVGVQIRRARDLEYVNTQQRVQFFVDSKEINFINPAQNLKVAIIQNLDLESAVYGLEPQFNLGNRQEYNYDGPASFWAGNEYLNFESRDFRAPNNNIDFVKLGELYNTHLYIDRSRFLDEYTYNPDINGGFLVSTVTNEDNDIQAEYTKVHFTMDPGIVLPEGTSVFVSGNYNGYQLQEENLMVHDEVRNLYTTTMLMKQGFYNYIYRAYDANGEEIPGLISGNKWPTENLYTVLAYYREPGGRYDRLIGIGAGNSANITN
ncbi:DUF5103 domain-containing protein [Nonlabens ponticola]|uniref:DUF5103 domain-containing protein n=2 Tax=Nonlabens ponticola TaxID=2496866 RepID=A0A3S9N0R7_9FLAO|nr:DUF5103 domain-containing protein [Nonlabens ponticola]